MDGREAHNVNLLGIDHEDMEELVKRHRQEQKELQGRITQKKKNATKKTRRGVNDECANLERDLSQKQAAEITELNGDTISTPAVVEADALNGLQQIPSNHVSDGLSLQSPPDETLVSEQTKKPNRQKARLAKRAAEQEQMVEKAAKEAENMPDLREQELRRMQEAASARGLLEHDIRPDGHCLYASIADQLNSRGIDWRSGKYATVTVDASIPEYRAIRHISAAYIAEHPDRFAPFLDQPLEQHLHNVRDTGEWGGHTELLSLAEACALNIKVLHADGHVDEIEGTTGGQTDVQRCLWLAFYQHSYGLGEHYNSLRMRTV